MFYRVVKLAVILFGLENWLISEAMDRMVDGDIYGVSDPYHREEGAAEGRWDVGDSQGRISVGSGKNPVGDDLHWKKTGDDGTVCGPAADF